MKILLIDNNTQHLDSLHKSLVGYDVEIQKYHPELDFHSQGKDLVILSGGGGEGLEIHDTYKQGKLWYEDEMRFVQDCNLPVVGICMGFEVVCHSFGSDIRQVPKLIQGYKRIQATGRGAQVFARKELKQFESHSWYVPAVDTDELEVLARSRTGVEIVCHRNRSIIASQFHPEKGGTLQLDFFIKQAVAR